MFTMFTMLQAPWEVEGNRPDSDWPSEGRVEFKDYKVRYRPGLDLVLKGLSFKVDSGEKVILFYILVFLIGSWRNLP